MAPDPRTSQPPPNTDTDPGGARGKIPTMSSEPSNPPPSSDTLDTMLYNAVNGGRRESGPRVPTRPSQFPTAAKTELYLPLNPGAGGSGLNTGLHTPAGSSIPPTSLGHHSAPPLTSVLPTMPTASGGTLATTSASSSGATAIPGLGTSSRPGTPGRNSRPGIPAVGTGTTSGIFSSRSGSSIPLTRTPPPQSRSTMPSVLLVHHPDDTSVAKSLKARLGAWFVRCWADEGEVASLAELPGRMAAIGAEVQCVGIILSPASVNPEWLAVEGLNFLAIGKGGSAFPLLPIRVRDCATPPFLGGRMAADFTEPDQRHELVRLMHALRHPEAEMRLIPGEYMMLLSDFVDTIRQFFEDRPVEIKFTDDWSAVAHVRVDMDNHLFRLYERHTGPSADDLLRVIFTPIIGREILGVRFLPEPLYPDPTGEAELSAEERERRIQERRAVAFVCRL